jgi:hypothetical protein
MAATLINPVMRLSVLPALMALSYERQGNHPAAASQLASAIGYLDVYRKTLPTMHGLDVAQAPSAALRLLFSQWLLEDQAGGPRTKTPVTFAVVKPREFKTITTGGGGYAQRSFEVAEEPFPWLYVLGGVAVVGTVGYVAWKRKH